MTLPKATTDFAVTGPTDFYQKTLTDELATIAQALAITVKGLVDAGVTVALQSGSFDGPTSDMPLIRWSAQLYRRGEASAEFDRRHRAGEETTEYPRIHLADEVTIDFKIDIPKCNQIGFTFKQNAKSDQYKITAFRPFFEGAVGTLFVDDVLKIIGQVAALKPLSNPTLKHTSIIEAP